MADLPHVRMIFTGGTISMRILPGRGAVPARGGREILAAVPQLAEVAAIECEDFDRLPGPHWTPARMMDLARRVGEACGDATCRGIVVTHGTDTLEETAYLLDLVLDVDTPVVLTGAMTTADHPTWDGPANLIAAARCAAAQASRGRGVLVVLDNAIHGARNVMKAHTEALDAFSSGEAGLLGGVTREGVRFWRAPSPRETIAVEALETRVALVPAAVGTDDAFLRHALALGARGIVLEAMGCGNVPPAMLPGVREAAEAGVPVVVTSRCCTGRTAPLYAYDGGGVTLRDAGAIFAMDLGSSKARVKLMALLGAGLASDAVRESFERAEC